MLVSLELISTLCAVISLVVSATALFKVNAFIKNQGQIQNVSGHGHSVAGRDIKK